MSEQNRSTDRETSDAIENDIRLFGIAFVEVEKDGRERRIDPMRVRIRGSVAVGGVAALAEREACAARLDARAKLIREEEFVGPREAAEAFREEAAAIRARGTP